MFINQNRLEHLLKPAQYFSAEQHQLELERLFLPSWHLLASKADLPKNGDFLTIELFGQPLILRNFDGDYRAFINVCAHRHCLLTHKPRGNDPRFVCQYHGWEYNKEGRTGRIPDARCFRPWDRENAHLKTVRTELCGDLIFICLEKDGPSLADHLGPYFGRFAQSFASPYRQAWTSDETSPANWKVFIENSLESYHVPVVHQKTFGTLPPESACEHTLTDRHTWYRTASESLGFLGWCAKRFGLPETRTYEHHNIHPNLNFSCLDGVQLLMAVFPTSPTTCRHRVCLFTVRGENPSWLGEVFGWLMAQVAILYVRQVNKEDTALYPDIQRGLEASTFRGVIGTREERVYAFQKYVVDRCSAPVRDRAIAAV
jgi:phenylpropionate dioxygenase-like ring-hydroxylating dioxygenase large terminal subunit